MKPIKRFFSRIWWKDYEDNLVVFGCTLALMVVICGAYVLASFGD